ncbi:MAG: (Fe-S)-binding protein, partial [Dehalococcoidia bacterium]
LISRIDEGLSEWTEDTVDKIYRCSQCSLCKELCEFKWGEDLVVQVGRENIVSGGRAPEVVKNLARLLIDRGTAYSKPPKELKVQRAVVRGKQPDVLYFAGDTAFSEHPEIIQATAVVLDSMGINWAMLEKGESTGVELFELGYTDEARKVASGLADKILDIHPRIIITGCAHAYRAFKELYPQWGIEAFKNIQIFHITEYLFNKVRDGELKLVQDLTLSEVCYHDPCQLGRKMGVYDAPRDLIKAITGNPPVELFHNRGEAECCGAGSVMYLTNPDISIKVAKRRMESVLQENAKLVITACPNCKNILTKANFDMHGGIKVLDIVELIALQVKDKVKGNPVEYF